MVYLCDRFCALKCSVLPNLPEGKITTFESCIVFRYVLLFSSGRLPDLKRSLRSCAELNLQRYEYTSHIAFL